MKATDVPSGGVTEPFHVLSEEFYSFILCLQEIDLSEFGEFVRDDKKVLGAPKIGCYWAAQISYNKSPTSCLGLVRPAMVRGPSLFSLDT